MDKVHLLTKLREYISSGEISKGVFIDVNVEKKPRYSPVGFLLKQSGVSDLDLIYLTESSTSTLNINSIFTGELNLPEQIINKIKLPLLYFGFSVSELYELEKKNDGEVHEELFITIYNLINNSRFGYSF
ncbi:hypothetical protein AWH56_013550 [Anaerobacillus isosaccharinicus]|uniref:Uncharacterized protein n=1 Tax=Anaerobacillus isosaccharinicus TaxID=1532552 RepID=A0A1S2KTP1_9BACI|nr:hypothetical protein [Anaerobacillus isosaccharinicus]MBA5588078.1 hypothetical protein [Anaerobacillus isosaccharinicus]QOY33783.1 hypothetical protein AWH56_013550 [Anaerobacillus isosaccharinicus]